MPAAMPVEKGPRRFNIPVTAIHQSCMEVILQAEHTAAASRERLEPRRPATGSELSLMLFSNMSSSETTGNFSAACTQYFTENTSLQLGIKVSAFPSSSHSDSGEGCVFEA